MKDENCNPKSRTLEYLSNEASKQEMSDYILSSRKCGLFVLSILLMFEYYLNISLLDNSDVNKNKLPIIRKARNKSGFILPLSYSNITIRNTTVFSQTTTKEQIIIYYKYPLINSTDVSMEYINRYNSSYYWFISMKHLFKNLGDEDTPRYSNVTPTCQLNESSLGPIKVNKTELNLKWVEQQNPDVILGGYYAPAHCRATQRVAVFVSYRDRKRNLIIFLHYIHQLLKKQSLDYRIFVIEQYGTEKFNKGVLYNIAFLEAQRFGTWHCLIFHDVDLIPEDERILYSCTVQPIHLSAAVESHGYALLYPSLFGGVTALTPTQYESVNGYSNCYWSWGAEDDDMYKRIVSKNYNVVRYNSSIYRYTTLPHPSNEIGTQRHFFLKLSKLRFIKEGLISTKYNLISVTKEKLYTHLLADVNPTKMKLDIKSMIRNIVTNNGKSLEYGGHDLQ